MTQPTKKVFRGRTTFVTCAHCGAKALREMREVRRAARFGYPMFCGRRCHSLSLRVIEETPDRPLEEIFCQFVREGLFRIDEMGQIWRGERRCEYQSKEGYLRVSFSYKGRHYKVASHRCVLAWAHNSEIRTGLVVNHLNGIKTDNRPENLEWTTPAGNTRHAFATGLMKPQRGESNPAAKLTTSDVVAIREAYATGQVTQAQLAEQYGLARVSAITSGRNWASAPGPTSKIRRCHKLTDADVIDIRARHKAGEPCVDLSKEYGVSCSMVWAVVSGKRRSRVPLSNDAPEVSGAPQPQTETA